MKTLLHIIRASTPARAALALAAAAVFAATSARASERWATLEAIHQIENPRDSSAPGPFGELGPYQFREPTWKMHTLAPFQSALDKKKSDAVAVKHYDWLKHELERRGVAISPYSIALAWNGGIRAAVSLHPPASTKDYASRAANLAAELQRLSGQVSP